MPAPDNSSASAILTPSAASRCWTAAQRTLRDLWNGDSERSGLQRNAIGAFLVRAASAGVLYLSQAGLARWMGQSEYGIYVLIWTWVLIFAGVASLGLPAAMIRLVPTYREMKEWALLRGVLLYGRLIAMASASIVAVLILAILLHYEDSFDTRYILPACFAMACLPAVVGTDMHDGISRGSGWMAIGLLPPYVLRPALLLLCVFVAHLADWPISAVTAIVAAIAASWLTFVVQLLLIERRLETTILPGDRTSAIKVWLGASLPLLATGGAELALQNTDVLVVSRFLSPSEVAIYFAAAKTMSLVLFIHYAVGSALANKFAAVLARNDHAALTAFARDAVNWTFWPSLAAALGILALGPFLLSLFGPNFIAGYPIMFILVAGFVARAAMGPAELLLSMSGRQKVCATIMATVAIANVLLALLLVPRYGIYGAATSTALAWGLGAALNTLAVKRHLGLGIAIWSNLPKR